MVALPYDPGFDLPDFKVLGENLWKIGAVAQFDAFDYAKPVQPPFKLEKSDLEDVDEFLSQYLLPKRGKKTFKDIFLRLSTHNLS